MRRRREVRRPRDRMRRPLMTPLARHEVGPRRPEVRPSTATTRCVGATRGGGVRITNHFPHLRHQRPRMTRVLAPQRTLEFAVDLHPAGEEGSATMPVNPLTCRFKLITCRRCSPLGDVPRSTDGAGPRWFGTSDQRAHQATTATCHHAALNHIQAGPPQCGCPTPHAVADRCRAPRRPMPTPSCRMEKNPRRE